MIFKGENPIKVTLKERKNWFKKKLFK
jgi:hypothetical protein